MSEQKAPQPPETTLHVLKQRKNGLGACVIVRKAIIHKHLTVYGIQMLMDNYT